MQSEPQIGKFNPYYTEGVNNLSITQFLNEIKVDFSYWLFRNEDYYPEACQTASELLYGFLSHYYPGLKLVFGHYTVTEYDGGTHCWIADNNGIIDFILFQFFMGKENKGVATGIPANILPDDLYCDYIMKYQKDVYINDVNLLLGYDTPDGCRLVKSKFETNGHESFFSYLNRIVGTEEFQTRYETPIKFIEGD